MISMAAGLDGQVCEAGVEQKSAGWRGVGMSRLSVLRRYGKQQLRFCINVHSKLAMLVEGRSGWK